MARKYSRDNRGRFAPKGSGATARGGRLRTAAGNKRATQTTKAAPAKPSGTVAGKVKRNPAAAGKIGQAKAAAKPPRFSAQDAADRKLRANQLKAMPKDLRRADRTARLAQREVMATNGAVGGNVIGRGRSSTQSKINSIREGLMRAKGDKTGSIRRQVVKEAKQLRARMQTTAAGPRTGAQSGVKRRTTRAAAPANTVANKTGQSKTLNRFNSRPERTRGAYVGGRYVDKSKLSGRQPLDLGRSDDRAFGRVATKAARSRAAAAKPAAKPMAKRKAVGSITSAKADRIIARIDANRPGQRRVAGSLRKSQNASRTHERATEFALGAAKRSIRRGKPIGTTESVRRAVANAAKKRRR